MSKDSNEFSVSVGDIQFRFDDQKQYDLFLAAWTWRYVRGLITGLLAGAIFMGILMMTKQAYGAQPDRRAIVLTIVYWAEYYGLDPERMVAVATVESSLNPMATGSLGERGLFQLWPKYHKCASFNVDINVQCALRYMKSIKDRHGERWPKAYIIWYNVGPNRKIKHPRKQSYYRKVQNEIQSRRQSYQLAQTRNSNN